MQAVQSMTGFGRAEVVNDDYHILVEMKSVNHRYLDLSLKIPRRFNCFETKIRQLLKGFIERGKVDVYITFEDYKGVGKRLIYNKELAEEYVACIKAMSEQFNLKNDLNAPALARYPDVLTMDEGSDTDEALWEIAEQAVKSAAKSFTEDRIREGEHLKADLLVKLEQIDKWVDELINMSPSIVEEYRNRLYDKIRETLSDSGITADEGRIVTEVAIYSDKICTDEEMVRLKSHIDAVRNKLKTGGSCGRELDFIAQEMNREANTTLSKANNLKKADVAIALKTEIEKIREQVQNIE